MRKTKRIIDAFSIIMVLVFGPFGGAGIGLISVLFGATPILQLIIAGIFTELWLMVWFYFWWREYQEYHPIYWWEKT